MAFWHQRSRQVGRPKSNHKDQNVSGWAAIYIHGVLHCHILLILLCYSYPFIASDMTASSLGQGLLNNKPLCNTLLMSMWASRHNCDTNPK